MDPQNLFCPFSNTFHMVMATMENTICEFNTRGVNKPTSIIIDDIETGEIPEGAYKGFPFIRVLPNYKGQKGNALSLKNYQQDAENTKKKTYPCPFNKCPLSSYQTLMQLMMMLPPKEMY